MKVTVQETLTVTAFSFHTPVGVFDTEADLQAAASAADLSEISISETRVEGLTCL